MINELRCATLISMAMLATGICMAQGDPVEPPDVPVLTGPYLGQKPPGLKPEVFAPGVITRSDYWEHSSPAFAPDGNEVFWSAHVGPRKQRIFHMRVEDGQWSSPEYASFWVDRHGGGPAFSPDGTRLYFYSGHPESHLAGHEFFNIWYVERHGDGWGNPQKLSSLINSDKPEEKRQSE